MAKNVETRNALIEKGYFPEVLPPCFDSKDLTRCFRGIISEVEKRKFHKRSSSLVRYSGTKHSGYRRYYATANPVPYFNVCAFIAKNWKTFQNKFNSSPASVGNIRLGQPTQDRAIVIPALSEVTVQMSSRLRHSPYILKTDISQFFPSLYTHAISWAAHGRALAKSDQSRHSPLAIFNSLDWFVQQCQSSQTRGLAVGPDAFRIIAEFIGCELDRELFERADKLIVGAMRHVDDYYIGVRSEADASVILSHLRDILQSYELQINDSKTKIVPGLETVDDLWAQELRQIPLERPNPRFAYALDKAHAVARTIDSQSPVKLMLRRFDMAACYSTPFWHDIEAMLQRVIWHYGHCIDYICLLLAKRYAIGEDIDTEGWSHAVQALVKRHLAFDHHHEICWLLWAALVCKLEVPRHMIEEVARTSNSHIKALLIAAHMRGTLTKKPPIRLGNKLATSDASWLHHLVARATRFSGAKFSGDFAAEFEHLADRELRLVDFDKHLRTVSRRESHAISASKYGYDTEMAEEAEDQGDDEF